MTNRVDGFLPMPPPLPPLPRFLFMPPSAPTPAVAATPAVTLAQRRKVADYLTPTMAKVPWQFSAQEAAAKTARERDVYPGFIPWVAPPSSGYTVYY